MKKFLQFLSVGIIAALCASCSSFSQQENSPVNAATDLPLEPSPTPVTSTPIPATPLPTETPPPDFSSIKPYEVGQIIVIMYHGIEEEPQSSFERTPEDFWNDLQTLYDKGYRAVSFKDLLENNISTEVGYTPVVITFDDGLKSAFSLEEENGVLVPVKNTGFEIMKRFYEQHPDFGFEATFFMNGYRDAFNGAGEFEERLNYLVESGCDIGNHTYSHTEMRPLSITEIQEELGQVDKIIRTALPDYEPVGVSYPYGSRPVEELRAYILDGEYDGANYHYDGALSVGMSGTHSTPGNKNFDVLNIPRARGSNDEETDLWDRLKFFDENPEYKYVSDGNPKTVVVPQEYEHNIDYEYFSKTELEVIKY